MIPKEKIDNLSNLILEVGRKIKERHKEENVKSPITHLCLGALKFVADAGKPTMKELADHFGITPPSATAMIEPLADSRFLIRDYDERDRRNIRLSITDKGKKVLEKNLQIARKGMESILSKMEEEEIDNLYSGLSHLLKIIRNK
jgi:DNA-binding MarR family transcriptional regulator